MKNGKKYEMNGWKYVSIHGTPKERGYAHGYLLASEIKEIQKMLRFIVMEDSGDSWDYYISLSNQYFVPVIMQHFPELYEEMQGITDGCNAAGTTISLDEVVAWNNSIVLLGYWKSPTTKETTFKSSVTKEGGGADDRCSAFIACGDYTTDGKIVCAHNSFCPFIDGQYYNVILDIKPTDGHRILMQTCPGWIWSGSDFFITSKGIIGTETTIGGFNQYNPNDPISCRIRKAMQYGNTLDEYTEILLKNNSGGYANSWLFGDINTNEIMRFELGLKYHDIARTKNGYFFGCNVAFDPKIRNLECENTGYCDIRRHQGARQVRLPDLMDKHKGKINIDIAQKIISDHYDVYLNKENPCSRTVCSHYNLDPREFMSQSDRPKPFQPKGAVDGAVVDSTMAANMKILMRWGNSCGRVFDADKFFQKHRQWDYLRPYIKNMGGNPWTEFTVDKIDENFSEVGTMSLEKESSPVEERIKLVTEEMTEPASENVSFNPETLVENTESLFKKKSMTPTEYLENDKSSTPVIISPSSIAETLPDSIAYERSETPIQSAIRTLTEPTSPIPKRSHKKKVTPNASSKKSNPKTKTKKNKA